MEFFLIFISFYTRTNIPQHKPFRFLSNRTKNSYFFLLFVLYFIALRKLTLIEVIKCYIIWKSKNNKTLKHWCWVRERAHLTTRITSSILFISTQHSKRLKTFQKKKWNNIEIRLNSIYVSVGVAEVSVIATWLRHYTLKSSM